MEELIDKLGELENNLIEIKNTLNINKKKDRLKELNFEMSRLDFWNDNDKAVEISQEAEYLKTEINRFDELELEIKNLKELANLAETCHDKSVKENIESKFKEIEFRFKEIEFFLLFSEENDDCNAIISIHAGTGGVDAQDWAEILERMYIRFAERKDFKIEVLERILANEAGIKTSVLKISGPFAYGYLKGENGVHRLVRISPFNADNLRHTSFAGVEVVPEIKGDDSVVIDEKDIRIDVFKSSGPGGQGVNTTDSAVRIVHIPTNISVSCQSERSQHQNKEKALIILKSKLYKMKLDENQKAMKEIKGDAGFGTWSKQIRSYVFQPYKMVKDHRTKYSTSDVDAVTNGNLDGFVEAYLNLLVKNKNK